MGSGERETSGAVVGVGASAGGLRAFQDLFSNLAPHSGMAFVVVQHLDPTHESMLTELLSNYTEMSVVQAEDGVELTPNTVFVIPPNRTLALRERRLHVAEPDQPRGQRLPIDILFRSMASQLGDSAVGIVLSGTGSDGTLGLREIKEAGGLIIAQEPESAVHDGMPVSAIQSGLVDAVLTPADIGRRLPTLVDGSPLGEVEVAALSERSGVDPIHRILRLLMRKTGHDFTSYKRNTIGRRIGRRLVVNQLDSLEEYVTFLAEHPAELEHLFRDLLIGVTHFFRDDEPFRVLAQQVIPQIVAAQVDKNDPVRVWVPACSTGEEAYSIAMLFDEARRRVSPGLAIQIFATDIDAIAIEHARQARYLDSITADVSEERLERYFERDPGRGAYHVSRHVRDMVIFAVHSVTKDAPFSRLQLVCCRNLLIYLEPALQRRVLSLFHYALLPGGHLLLGNSENLGAAERLFESIDGRTKIFRRKEVPAENQALLELPLAATRSFPVRPRRQGLAPLDLEAATHRALLEYLSPDAVVVNESGEMLVFHGDTSDYLSQPPGALSTNVFTHAREGLRVPLGRAIRKAFKTAEPVQIEAEFSHGPADSRRRGCIEAIPFRQGPAMQGLALVLFRKTAEPSAPAAGTESETSDPLMARNRELEQEVEETRAYLSDTIEDLGATNEELESTNEELQSANEELQSTNEELQTSKEELQSTNEELVTVNTELRAKIEELTLAHDDIRNVLDSTQIGLIFLDNELRIRRYTVAATQIVDLIPADLGRPLARLAHNLDFEGLLERAEQVLRSHEPFQRDVRGPAGRWYILRMMPYQTSMGEVDGIVLTFHDITSQKEVEASLRRSETRLAMAIRAGSAGIYEHSVPLGPDTYHSARWAEILGYTISELPSHDRFIPWLQAHVHPQDLPRRSAAYEALSVGETSEYRVESRMRTKGGEWIWVEEVSFATERDDSGKATHVVGLWFDITRRKAAESKGASERLEAMGTLAGGIAHDFNNSLASIRADADYLRLLTENEEIRAVGTRIADACGYSRDLIRQVMAFSRHQQERPERCDVVAAAQKAKRVVGPRIPPQVRVEYTLPDHPAWVRATPTQLEQIVVNLMDNAIEAMGDAGGRLMVSVATQSAPPGRQNAPDDVTLTVTDTGPGIPPENVARIFEPFFTTKAPASSGMGLSVVHGIVESHGGTIRVDSVPRAGTAFAVWLPGAPPPAQDRPTPTRAEQQRQESATTSEGARVFLVDDNAPLLERLARLLRKLGYEVTPFAEPTAALEAFVAAPDDVDLLMSDVSMPGMEGSELAERMRQYKPTLPVVLCSGFLPSEADSSRYTYLLKPVSAAKLSATLASSLEAAKTP